LQRLAENSSPAPFTNVSAQNIVTERGLAANK
jgi:hypothetical protein